MPVMALEKIILYYGFSPLEDPESVKLWQQTLCESLNLKGRIIISAHGINGTVGGELTNIKKYIKATRQYPGFRKIDFKYSDGSSNDFPRLSVKVRKELVAFNIPDELRVSESGVVGGGVHLRPEEVHELVEKKGDEVVFFDGRNAMEARIGKFKNAVVPDVVTTHDFITEIESGKYDHLKDKPIVTYCTGGIRCEVLSGIMKNRGFQEVYQIKGGIVRYGETFKDQGLWEGSLYVFDKRMTVDFSDQAKVIGDCDNCGSATKNYYDCVGQTCKAMLLLCDSCANKKDALKCSESHANVKQGKLQRA